MSSDEDDELFGPSGSGQAASAGTDEELTLPRAAMNKMIKEVMPNIRVANEARELILQCSTDFIHLLSSEANDICDKQQKKTISPEHVLLGMFFLSYAVITFWGSVIKKSMAKSPPQCNKVLF